ncbi:MAG: hypothetical protein ABI807_10120 [Sporichthyaceae bacterium]
MPGDEVDEVTGGGAERDPVRLPRWLSVLAVVVAVVLAGYVALRPADAPRQERQVDGASPVRSPSPISMTPSGEPQSPGPLALAGTCLTLGRQGFTVVFGLQNNGLGRVTVVSVSAHRPASGLEPTRGRVPAGRTCGGAQVDVATSAVLEPGDRLPVSLSFRAPVDCPAPYPVQVDVAIVNVGENPGSQRMSVLPDLGGYQGLFTACDRG